MKRTLLFMAYVLASMSMLAQDVYHTFLEEGKVWTYQYYNMTGQSFNVIRVVDGDTIIGGSAYKKICDNAGGKYLYALREEGKKVYIAYNNQETSSLLYDFGKDKGDIISQELDEQSGLVSERRVVGVDTIDINGLKFRRLQIWEMQYNIQDPVNWEEEEVPWQMASYWIEGVGSECLLEASFRQTGNYYTLKSCQIDGRTYTQQELLQEPSKPNDDYLPFVELGKQWHVTSTASNPYNSLYCFSMLEEVERNGKTYVHTCYSDNEQKNHYYELLREENKRVYKYDDWEEKEYLLYDFSLKEGDIFTYELMSGLPEQWKILKQGWLEDGPNIVTSCTSNPDGTLDIQYRKLRTWTVGRENSETGEYDAVATWVECVGSLEGMFCQYCTGGTYYLSFVERAEDMGDHWENNIYLPFSFYNNNVLFKGNRVHGSNMPTGATNHPENGWFHNLTYELEGDRLHVYGDVYSNCGPNNYAYFFEEPTDDPSVHKIEFLPYAAEPAATCMRLHSTDFYVPGFDPNLNYYVIDNRGVEQPVINKMAYRPMIEDGKVWKVGSAIGISDDIVKMVDYYYFDGDTIINGKTCKQMMFQRYVSPDYLDYDQSKQPSLDYVGAWYEEDKKVYLYYKGQQSMRMMYDFSLDANTSLLINNDLYLVGPRQTEGLEGFKGIYRDVMFCANEDQNTHITFWLEGVGGIMGPGVNAFNPILVDPQPQFLMSCTVGDEVIYLNDKYEDGATPTDAEAKKHRFDFTHTIKTKPRTRSEAEEQSLYGEYNNLLLGINLEPLDEAYLVRITNESGQVVYEKNVNAGNIVGLNIDISAFAKGRYTVTMENSSEVFTGEFETITTGIQELKDSRIEGLKSIYNLQGQRLNRLQKGLNIVNGRKVFVK